jgi:hypothetical protein
MCNILWNILWNMLLISNGQVILGEWRYSSGKVGEKKSCGICCGCVLVAFWLFAFCCGCCDPTNAVCCLICS